MGEHESRLSGKRVLVTGGYGFLGSRVVKQLQQAGAKVHTFHRDMFNLLDRVSVHELFRIIKPEIVIHLAATVGGIGDNVARPADMLYDNAMMGLHVLDACNNFSVEKLVMIGTVCSYPRYAGLPMLEDDIWNGYPEKSNAPYGIAKRMLLAGIQSYRQQYGLNAIYLVLTNLYGPGDNFDLETSHAIPAIIRKMHEAKINNEPAIRLWGTGKPTRDMLYVDDAAEAIIMATEKYNKPEPVNIASGVERSIRDIAETIGFELRYDGQIIWQREKPGGQPRRVLDTSRASREFGFTASMPLSIGIERTVDWFLEQTENSQK